MFRNNKHVIRLVTKLAFKVGILPIAIPAKTRLDLPIQTIDVDQATLNKIENPDWYINHILQKMKIETSASLCSRIKFDIVKPTPTKWKINPYVELYDPSPESNRVKLYFKPKKQWSTENVSSGNESQQTSHE